MVSIHSPYQRQDHTTELRFVAALAFPFMISPARTPGVHDAGPIRRTIVDRWFPEALSSANKRTRWSMLRFSGFHSRQRYPLDEVLLRKQKDHQHRQRGNHRPGHQRRPVSVAVKPLQGLQSYR